MIYNPGVIIVDLKVVPNEEDNRKIVEKIYEAIENVDNDINVRHFNSIEEGFLTNVVEDQLEQRGIVIDEDIVQQAVTFIQNDESAWRHFDNAIDCCISDINEGRPCTEYSKIQKEQLDELRTFMNNLLEEKVKYYEK